MTLLGLQNQYLMLWCGAVIGVFWFSLVGAVSGLFGDLSGATQSGDKVNISDSGMAGFFDGMAKGARVAISCGSGVTRSHRRCFQFPKLEMSKRNRTLMVACKSRGFTLLELLVVVAIIALLASYVGPKYFSQIGKSEQSVARSQIQAFSRALGTFRLDVGSFPSTEEGLIALTQKPANAAKWGGPYLEKSVPLDPWGHPYFYRAPGSKSDFDLLSYGRDGQPGGEGDAADLSND